MAKTTWDDVGKKRTEEREYVMSPAYSEMGRSRVRITCPFCGEELTVYLWSLAGCGKRCPCGAIFSWYGGAFRVNARAAKAAGKGK